MSVTDKLLWIEANIPKSCEFLVRTNHDPDNKSLCNSGKWFVHLQKITPFDITFNYDSLYKNCSDNLNSMLDDVIKLVKEGI